jgi:hypothetical protein
VYPNGWENHECAGLAGTISPALGESPALAAFLLRLDVDRCAISGAIPESLGGLGQQQQLSLDHTAISGAIPKSLNNLGQLEYLSLDGTQVTGCASFCAVHPSMSIACQCP